MAGRTRRKNNNAKWNGDDEWKKKCCVGLGLRVDDEKLFDICDG